jgi:hypothetical protein
MRQRCRNPRNPRWADYGGRGITICERWNSYANFLADMGERPAGMSLERIDNDGNYEPSNCKWATQAEQIRNQRRNWLRPAHILEIRQLLDTGISIWEIAAAVGMERHVVGYVALTIQTLRVNPEPHS